MKVTFNDAPQGSPEWLQARKGRCTGSKFKYARDYKVLTKAQKEAGRTRGDPSEKLVLYAQDVARERLGGNASPVFVTKSMNFGTEQEPIARSAYETMTGNFVQEAGFAATDCGMFGLSVDGLVDDDGVIEIKTMVGSGNLFTCVIENDYSEYMDQCLGYLLFLGREWVDLCCWTPDLEAVGLGLHIHRINRCDHESGITALKSDLMAFSAMVQKFESQLRIKAAANIDMTRQAA